MLNFSQGKQLLLASVRIVKCFITARYKSVQHTLLRRNCVFDRKQWNNERENWRFWYKKILEPLHYEVWWRIFISFIQNWLYVINIIDSICSFVFYDWRYADLITRWKGFITVKGLRWCCRIDLDVWLLFSFAGLAICISLNSSMFPRFVTSVCVG